LKQTDGIRRLNWQVTNMKNRIKKHLMTLQDVIGIVSRFSRNDHEMSLVVADLLNRGLVRVNMGGQPRRIVVR
jgi:hypothetical protein